MDKLYENLYMIYVKELSSLNIGHELDKLAVQKMLNIIGDILITKILLNENYR
jgi:hypothetical protein